MAGTIARNEKQKAIIELQSVIRQTKRVLASRERKLDRLRNSLLRHVLNKEPKRIMFCHYADKPENGAIKIIASRLSEARALCAHTFGQAAQLLDVNVDDLKAIENGIGIGHIPLWLIKKAAEVYDVSTDFLFGLNDDWEAGDIQIRKERDFLAIMQRLQIDCYSKTIAGQIRQDNQLKAVSASVVAFGMSVQYISEVFIQFRQLNPVVFDNMPGSARVLRQIKLAEELGQYATCELNRYKCLPESLAAHAQQMDEIFPNNNGSFAD
ncbi:MAG TPA: hypothetical protein VIF10_01230 [Methylobacter sp.]